VEIESLTLTGGEPLLRHDLQGFLNISREFSLNTGLLTNGTLMTPRLAAEFRDLDVEVFITLDSITPDYHNNVRGEHESVMQGLHFLSEALVPRRNITTVVSRGNIDQIEPLRMFAKKDGFDITFHPASLSARDRNNLVNCTQEEIQTLLRHLHPWAHERNRAHYLSLFAWVARFGHPPKLRDCKFARTSLIINSDGLCYPCFQHKTQPLGNVLLDSPKQIITSRQAFVDVFRPASCIRTDCLGVF